MIQEFRSIQELFQAIEADKSSHAPSANRYPIRFIFLNDFAALRSLIKDYFSQQKTTIKQVKEFLTYEDAWLTSDDMLDIIKSVKEDTLIAPLSEVLRFADDSQLTSIFTSFFEVEQPQPSSPIRIYLPFVGLKDRFTNLAFQRFHRNHQWAPIWSLSERIPSKITIFQLVDYQGTLPKTPSGFYTLHHTSDWFDLWKHEGLQKVICRSQTMAYLYGNFLPDAIFQAERIVTLKDYLEKILYIPLPVAYHTAEKHFWEHLIENAQNSSQKKQFIDFDYLLNTYFNIQNFKTLRCNALLALWFQQTETFGRWLLKQWILTQTYLHGSYLFHVVKDVPVSSNEELISRMWFKIFENKTDSNQHFEERKTYLFQIHLQHNIPIHSLEERIREKLQPLRQKPLHRQAQYLTNLSVSERTYIFELLREHVVSNRSAILDVIKDIYPELFFYLQWSNIRLHDAIEDWIVQYFTEYTLSKATHKKGERLDTLLNEKNSRAEKFYEWYYHVKSSVVPKNAHVVWLDGVGAEWLPLLEYFINKHGKAKNKYLRKAHVTKANLPTITECNRFEHAEHVRDFDSFIHEKETPYVFPDTLLAQFSLLEELVKRYIVDRVEDEIVIVADHGCTFLAQKEFGNFKKHNFQEAEHEGRYVWTDQRYQEDAEFLCHVQEGMPKKYALIASKHTSLYNTPSREVHGGATPEEVLVPYLVISKIDDRIVYHVRLLTSEISVREPAMRIKIEPHPPTTPILLFKGKEIRLEKENEEWGILLKGFKTGKYQFKLQVVEQKFDIAITIKSGFKEEDLL